MPKTDERNISESTKQDSTKKLKDIFINAIFDTRWLLSALIFPIATLLIYDLIKSSTLTPTMEYEILILILIIGFISFGVIVGFKKYRDIIDLYKEIDRNKSDINEKTNLIDQIPNDVIIKKHCKNTIFTKDSISSKEAQVCLTRELYNNMDDENYDFFRMKIKSPEDVPSLDSVTVEVNGKKISLENELRRQSDSKKPRISHLYDSCLEKYNLIDAKPEHKILQFYVPLELKPKDTCEFTISFKTKAFKDALEGKEDYFETKVMRVTERLVTKIILDDEMKKMYSINESAQKDGSPLSFRIYDASKERMQNSEQSLINKSEKPRYENHEAVWVINRPKIGYTYRMYFTLKPRHENKDKL